MQDATNSQVTMQDANSAAAIQHLESDANYGPARGVRLTGEEQGFLEDLMAYYRVSGSEVLRMGLRLLFDKACGE